MADLMAGFYAVAIYAGLNGLILAWLLTNVGRKRAALKISIGDGGNIVLIRAMRGQANFVENVPMALVFMILMALLGTPVWLLHILGASLVVGRFFHALHFVADDAPGWQRAAGIGLTFLVLVVGALGLIAHGVANVI